MVKIRWTRRGGELLVAALLVAFVGPASPAADPPVVDQTGWWSSTGRTFVPGVTPAVPAPPNVPPGSIAVSAVAGQTNAVAAVGIVLGLESGSSVSKLTLALKPAGGNGTDNTTPTTAIRACPITVFWAGVENGPLDSAPASDCNKVAVAGVRGADAVWTFDLTPIATLWVNPDSGLSPNGVLLQPSPSPPGQSFSIAFGTGSSIVARLEAMEPAPPPDEPVSAEEQSASGPVSTVPEASIAEPAPFTSGTDQAADIAVVTSPPAPAPGPPEPAVAEPTTVKRILSRGTSTFGGWPLSVFVAVLLALVIAGLASLTLGLRPDEVGERREGGLSRALARTNVLENR